MTLQSSTAAQSGTSVVKLIAVFFTAWALTAQASPQSEPAAATQSRPTAAVSAGLTAVPIVSNSEIHVQLSALERGIKEVGDKAKASAERTSWFSLGTVVVSGFIALFAQGLMMRHQRKQSDKQARDEISNSYVEWQLKQLSEFYGPLRALLGQSNVMYRQMNRLLVSRDPSRFRFSDGLGRDFDGKVFEIYIDGKWTRFRTVNHLGEVYQRGYGVEPIFDAVAEVGRRIAGLIEEKAGYIRQDQEALVHVMGKYLAHFATLEEVHRRAKASSSGDEPYRNDDAVFPTEIQKFVDEGFQLLNDELRNWQGRTKPC